MPRHRRRGARKPEKTASILVRSMMGSPPPISATVPAAPAPGLPWRVGRKVGNTLYYNDIFVGSCISEEYASKLVATANGAPPMLGLSHERLVSSCANIGFNLSCPGCAELFFTGVQLGSHDPTCTRLSEAIHMCNDLECGVCKWSS
jgi:hypothetical protein